MFHMDVLGSVLAGTEQFFKAVRSHFLLGLYFFFSVFFAGNTSGDLSPISLSLLICLFFHHFSVTPGHKH